MLSRRLQRARIRAVPAQHSWAALPGPLVNKLLNDQVETPVVLKLTPVPGAGGRDQQVVARRASAAGFTAAVCCASLIHVLG